MCLTFLASFAQLSNSCLVARRLKLQRQCENSNVWMERKKTTFEKVLGRHGQQCVSPAFLCGNSAVLWTDIRVVAKLTSLLLPHVLISVNVTSKRGNLKCAFWLGKKWEDYTRIKLSFLNQRSVFLTLPAMLSASAKMSVEASDVQTDEDCEELVSPLALVRSKLRLGFCPWVCRVSCFIKRLH